MELLDATLLGWSRAQFAMTAMYHWLFVPLTLGLGMIVAIMETIYVRTGKDEWKKATKFWATIFGINFAIGVATGIILEFEFGTNWSNYSWFVGDIFGAPLAIEGIMAFFLEATFISIMFFGWKKVSKGMHLTATWLTVGGATISALWILVANAWMQYPVGMHFNPDMARNEMTDFWAVLLSPVAINKFTHTVLSGWVLGSLVVLGISGWFLLKKRDIDFSIKSMKVASVFGIIAIALSIYTGDDSAYHVAQKQPMKLAAMEGLYHGQSHQGLVAMGILNPKKTSYNDDVDPFLFKIEIPGLLSGLGYRDFNAFVPGIDDIINGGYATTDSKGNPTTALSFVDRQASGQLAKQALANYQKAKIDGDSAAAAASKAILMANYSNFGYGYLDNAEQLIPNVPLLFYGFRIMVGLGFLFLLLFLLALFFVYKKNIEKMRWFNWILIFAIPFGYLASEMGWVVAEVGRQPWAIQNVLPVQAALTSIQSSSVIVTFFLFLVLFSVLLIAELRIMFKQIKKGPEAEK